MRHQALRLIAASVLLLGAAAFLVDCSGCGGVLAVGETSDAGADATPSPGDAGASDALPDALPPDAGGGDAPSPEAAPDGSLDCLYGDASAADVEAGGAGSSGPCPPQPPVVGSPCGTTYFLCEYGNSWWSRCDLLLSCTHGVWQASDYGPQGCPELDAGPSGGACAVDTCPATWAEAIAIADAGPCPASSCQYAEGDCLCGAGTLTACSADTWSCLPVQPGCVSPRPRYGSPCTPDASSFCQMGWQCNCQQELYCDVDAGIWAGNPLGQGCMM